jgi:hypothetical protein
MRFRRAGEDSQQRASAALAENAALKARLHAAEAEVAGVEAFTRKRWARTGRPALVEAAGGGLEYAQG